MATKTSLIQLVNVGEDKSIHNLNPKTVGKGVSVDRTNQKIPSSVTDVQTLCNALGKLAFNDKYTGITAADFADGVITQELNITETGKIADARALKTLNDTLTTQGRQITQINNNYETLKERVDKIEEEGVPGGGGGQSGEISGGDDIGGSVDDPTSDSDKVVQNPGPITSDIIDLDKDDLSYGTYSFCVRAKVSAITDCAVFSMNAYSLGDGSTKTLLKTIDINANMFANVDTYQTIGFIFEYAGTAKDTMKKLKLVIGKPAKASGSGTPTVTIDYIMLNRATPAIYAIE